ncbi:extracellular solute-binding protein [Curtobacterium flaccumfaciens]|nr:extracellular solute-binding protein [Curtobacterium flaccumfaciens]
MSRHAIRRIATAIAIGSAGVLVAAGCSSGSSADAAKSAPDHLTGTVHLWHFFTGHNADVVEQAVAGFEKANPDVTVDVHAGQDDEKMQKAIAAGQQIDVGVSYSTAIVGSFCSSGAFRDLSPYIKRDKVDLDDIPTAVRDYTQYKGKRCVLPMLADTSALLYNTEDLAAAGISEPPKTLDELEADGLKLTTYNADGSIKKLGFNPLIDFYENGAGHFAPMVNGKFLRKDGSSAIGSSAGWKKLIAWQKAYVDKIGYDKLKKYTAGLGQEFSGDNAFQHGDVAMEIDGEYRIGYIDQQTPDLQYAAAPTPVLPGYGNYGASYITGNVAGIGKGSKNPEAAWALLKYLSTTTSTQVELGNGVKNVPTLTSALQSPDLQTDGPFKTFIDAANDANTITTPATSDGASYLPTFQTWWATYQEKGGNLDASLKKLDSDIDNANQLAGP